MRIANTIALTVVFAVALLCDPLSIACAQEKGEPAVVYTAKKIITMDKFVPEATAVAVADGRIFAVGSLQDVRRQLGSAIYVMDERFKDKVLVPGFIDNHLHPLLVGGFVLQMNFGTPFDWNLPSGRIKGVQGRDAYLARLHEIEAGMKDPDDILWTWGHHPLFHGDIWREDLDKISSTRPIVIWARSFHEVVLNTPALKELGIDDPNHPQVDWMKGWFMESGYKEHFLFNVAPYLLQPERLMPALKEAGMVLHLGGITTAADMAAGGMNLDTEFNSAKAVYENDETPFRMFYVPVGTEVIADRYGGLEHAAHFYATLPDRNTHRIRWVKQVKLFGDGAFFSQLMQMQDGYLDGHKGEWIQPPDEFERAARVFWNRGWQIHAHINGDLGMEMALDVVEKLMKENPRQDHRFTMHHAGYFTKDQTKRMGELGVVVSAQPYYLHALGDKYSEVGLGPERAPYMGRYKSLLDNGVKLSFHSDFTMAPAEPLKLMWVAVNRFSASGKVLGPDERITVEQALRAVTLDAAYAIHMEDEIGSISPGKVADFTVLEQDPY
jgi:predicted amidohydrolase YtcJ